MKKTVIAAASIALLAMAACSGNGCKDNTCSKSDDDKVYTGVLPAADCAGVRYTLTLDYDDDERDGDYTLLETYLEADTLSALGYKDLKNFVTKGDFTVEKQGEKTYLKLVKDAKESSNSPVDATLYFVVDGPSTITMTNAQLETSESPLNYTLTLAE